MGVLADNVPEFAFLLGGCAFAGAVLVALNPARRGTALARDVTRTDCQLVLAERQYAALLPAMDVPVLPLDGLELPGQAPLDAVPAAAGDLLMLIFTSGTSGEPKAVRCTHGKIAFPGQMLASRFGLTPADTVYISMPLFHSNAIMAGWAVGLSAGAAIALRRRFSASAFLSDVRFFGATYANYVGKPLSYVLATPPRADDADNPLRIAYGNEGAPGDLARFAGRFGCQVIDGFGSSEGGVSISRTPDTPQGALGRLADGVAVLDPETGRRCPPARFGPGGELLNPAEAVGEFVNTRGAGLFAGYYGDAEADASRMRDGMYWSGDLGYVDAGGFCWFAGRAGEWLRVDGENLGTAPIERALLRQPAVAEAAVYGVPDPVVGDQIMACLVLRDGASLTPGELGAFLAAQGDLGPRQHPRFVRVASQLPRTPTFKVRTRVLAADRWNTSDPVWWRPYQRGHPGGYEVLDADQAASLDTGTSPATPQPDPRHPHFSPHRAPVPPRPGGGRGAHPAHDAIHLTGGQFWGRDPHPELTWMRANAPVYWDERSQAWGISKHADVRYASVHPETFSNAGGIRADAPSVPMMIDMDDPAHLRRRKIVSQGFTPRRVAGLRPRIRQVCDEILDRVCERGECDFVWDIAAPLPLIMIADALGAAPEDHDLLLRWSDDLLRGLTDVSDAELAGRAATAFEGYWGYMSGVIADRRDGPRDDLISVLVHADIDGDCLDQESLIHESLLILIGGDETTRHVLSGGAYQLFTHPAQRQLLAADPGRIPVAVEEMLRWVSPIKNMNRTLTRDIELRGQLLREGDNALLLYPSANRDEDVFADPFRFDVTRQPNEHLAFGLGSHFCLGSSLARLELTVMFERLLERFPDMEPASPAEPACRPANFISGYESLPVRFSPGRRRSLLASG